MTTWEDARSADARKVVEWLDAERPDANSRLYVIDRPQLRKLNAMRAGRQGKVDVYALDRLLVALGLHLSDLPEDVWLSVGSNARNAGAVAA